MLVCRCDWFCVGVVLMSGGGLVRFSGGLVMW